MPHATAPSRRGRVPLLVLVLALVSGGVLVLLQHVHHAVAHSLAAAPAAASDRASR